MSRRRLGHDWRLQTLPRDAFSALSIFLLGLPLSLGAALASGAPPTAGLVAAAVAGLVCGAIGGAPLMVTGPVVALATMSAKIVGEWGMAALCAVTLCAGLLQLLFAGLRLGRWSQAVAPSVLEGMLAGIGITLMSTQLMVVLGAASRGRIWANLGALPQALARAEPGDLAVAGATLAISVAWERTRLQRVVPSMLVSLAAVSLGLWLLGAQGLRFIEVPTEGFALMGGGLGAALNGMGGRDVGRLFGAAVELALVGSVYSLLSAASIERLTCGRRTRLNLELMAQGLANALSALAGGLPVSGAVLRSSANVRAGAASSLSLFLQGSLMVLAITHLRDVLSLVPTSALAATFLRLGLHLVSPARLRHFWRQGEGLSYLATAAGVVTVNLFVGVVLGLAVTLLRLVGRVCRYTLTQSVSGGTRRFVVGGIACFAHVPDLLTQLGRVPATASVRVEFATYFADDAVMQAIAQWCEGHRRAGGRADWVAPRDDNRVAGRAA